MYRSWFLPLARTGLRGFLRSRDIRRRSFAEKPGQPGGRKHQREPRPGELRGELAEISAASTANRHRAAGHFTHRDTGHGLHAGPIFRREEGPAFADEL